MRVRFLPRLPLYSAVAALAATCTLLLTTTPAAAQNLRSWAESVGEDLDSVECKTPTSQTGAPMTGTPWHVHAVGLEQAHEHNTGLKPNGEPVKVAVLDSGVEAGHPTFGGNVLPGADPYDPSSDAQCDLHGHGTAVAGIIAGGHDQTRFMGVAPDAQIIPFRIFPTGEEGGNNTEIPKQIAATIEVAVDAGADVINISIAVLASPELEQAVEYAWSKGVLIVAATGNEKKYMNDEENDLAPKDEVYYPANYPKVLAVGATDINGALYADENYGDNMDLIAPGEGISLPSNSGEGYISNQSGTSFAAPHVAGAVALLIGKYGDEVATPQWITDRLIDTATHPADGFNEFQGHGLLNLPKALTASTEDEGDDEETVQPSFEPRHIEAFPVDHDPLATEKVIGWASLGIAITLITLVLVLKKIIPLGRRRGWRPGARRSENPPVSSGADTV